MMRWADTLVGRLLMLQFTVAGLLFILFLVSVNYLKAGDVAQSVPQLSVVELIEHLDASAQPAPPRSAAQPVAPPASAAARFFSGAPPSDAHAQAVMPRHRVLAFELRAWGVQLRRVALANPSDSDTITWLELQRGPAPPQWVGFRGVAEGSGFRGARGVALLGVLLTLLAGVWWIGRRVTRPLLELRRALERYQALGELPPPPAPGAPLEVRQLAQQFSDWARQQAQYEETRRLMLAGVSHDLRSPLGRIRMAAELLPRTPETLPRRDAIVRNVQLANRLIGSFIDLARATDDPLQDAVELGALLQALARDGDASDVQVVLESSAALWLRPANALGLERMLANLLDNARAHGQPPIRLTLSCADGQALLTVRDHGDGVPEAQRDRLLQPFQRGAFSRNTPGTGLGLAIVQRTAQRHGGSVRLVNAGPGLQVEVRLPVAPASAE